MERQNNRTFAKQLYAKAIAKLMETKTEEERFYALGRAAKCSIDVGKIEEAKELAKELQKLMQKYPNNWNYGNAIQDTNIVFGRIAILEGRIEDARKHLLEAGKSPGSPQMNSFGPNMGLAKDLLEKGEKEVVLQYFELCSIFWTKKDDMRKQKTEDILKEWAQQVSLGQIPDFKANLFY